MTRQPTRNKPTRSTRSSAGDRPARSRSPASRPPSSSRSTSRSTSSCTCRAERSSDAASAPAHRPARRGRRGRAPVGDRRWHHHRFAGRNDGVHGLHWAAMPPSRVETIDPRTLHVVGRVRRKQPRHAPLKQTAGSWRASSRSSIRSSRSASSYPAGSPSPSAATSTDVVHGFVVGTTNANVMLVPGFIATFTTTFPKTGEHLMPCHEYCGTGHEAMWARVQVIPANEFLRAPPAGERINCVRR